MKEWSYQYKGDTILKVGIDDGFGKIPISEDEMYLPRSDIAHCSTRFRDTVGIVLAKIGDKMILMNLGVL